MGLNETRTIVQKNRNRDEASNYATRPNRFAVPNPEVMNVDDLGMMLDEDLMIRLRNLEDDKGKVCLASQDTRPWEEEIAYIRREQQIRRCRRDAHQDYLRKTDGEYNQSEVGLPSGNFDNLDYVYAASGGRPRWN